MSEFRGPYARFVDHANRILGDHPKLQDFGAVVFRELYKADKAVAGNWEIQAACNGHSSLDQFWYSVSAQIGSKIKQAERNPDLLDESTFGILLGYRKAIRDKGALSEKQYVFWTQIKRQFAGEKDLTEELLEHPLVESALEAFPGATIENVREMRDA